MATRLQAVVAELSAEFLERDAVVRAIVIAMLAGQHSFLLGPPGTAKSELSRALTARISGARRWEFQMSKFTSPTKMFGPIDVAALTQGEYRQILDGRATTAHIAFIDEIFKCNLGALNEMLSFLNERLYIPESGGDPVVCPLISAVTASNELPAGEEAAAIWDRLTVRLVVDYLTRPASFDTLLRSAVAAPAATAVPTTIDLSELQRAVTVEVPAVAVPDGIIDTVSALREQLAETGVVVSDRRWRQSVRLLQASAWLDARDQVTDNDLAILTHVLWSTLAQRETVNAAVVTMINPDAAAVLDEQEALQEQIAQFNTKLGGDPSVLNNWAINEALPKLRAIEDRLTALKTAAQTAGRATDTIDEVMAQRAAFDSQIMVDVLKIRTPRTGAAQ
ncbi:AAA family ATPase [Nocardia sp. CA-107356]|uniref:AAA family ATPase n=1 Tax=Nocardia sp. CA-107356 TaxID=3239972 RepID=UPI003D91710B